jgi:hypothetical protein
MICVCVECPYFDIYGFIFTILAARQYASTFLTVDSSVCKSNQQIFHGFFLVLQLRCGGLILMESP